MPPGYQIVGACDPATGQATGMPSTSSYVEDPSGNLTCYGPTDPIFLALMGIAVDPATGPGFINVSGDPDVPLANPITVGSNYVPAANPNAVITPSAPAYVPASTTQPAPPQSAPPVTPPAPAATTSTGNAFLDWIEQNPILSGAIVVGVAFFAFGGKH